MTEGLELPKPANDNEEFTPQDLAKKFENLEQDHKGAILLALGCQSQEELFGYIDFYTRQNGERAKRVMEAYRTIQNIALCETVEAAEAEFMGGINQLKEILQKPE